MARSRGSIMRSVIKVKPLINFNVTVKCFDGSQHSYFMMFSNPVDAVIDALERHGICKVSVRAVQ